MQILETCEPVAACLNLSVDAWWKWPRTTVIVFYWMTQKLKQLNNNIFSNHFITFFVPCNVIIIWNKKWTSFLDMRTLKISTNAIFLNRGDWITNETSHEIKNVYHLSLHTLVILSNNLSQTNMKLRYHAYTFWNIKNIWQYIVRYIKYLFFVIPVSYQNKRVNTSLESVLLCILVFPSFALFESNKYDLNCHRYNWQRLK